MKMFKQLIVILLFVLVSPLYAKTVVLIHGYHSDGDVWRYTGIAPRLLAGGYADGGHLITTPIGMVRINQRKGQGQGQFITLSLPSEAPLMVQASHLNDYISYIRNKIEPGELILVGHSVGGVVARLMMVKSPEHRVDQLITIAAPHLGSGISEVGVIASQTPVSWFLPVIGAESINRSQGLLYDISREQTGNILFWLNRQPHPKAQYVSIVREEGGIFEDGDMIVPTYSQDMNRIPTLEGRSALVFSVGGHNLIGADGDLLLQILSKP